VEFKRWNQHSNTLTFIRLSNHLLSNAFTRNPNQNSLSSINSSNLELPPLHFYLPPNSKTPFKWNTNKLQVIIFDYPMHFSSSSASSHSLACLKTRLSFQQSPTMKSYFSIHPKLSQVNEVDYRDEVSTWKRGNEVDNAFQPKKKSDSTVQHCSGWAQSAPSLESCFSSRRDENNTQERRYRVWTRKNCMQRVSRMCCEVWKPKPFKRRRTLVHPYVSKLAKFSPNAANNADFFSPKRMGASQTIEFRWFRRLSWEL
jgi:hypothetical protein